MTRERAYGTWPSPLTLDDLVAGSVARRWLSADRDDLYWVESDPTRAGRGFVRHLGSHEVEPRWLSELAVRSRVHDVGARPLAVGHGWVVVVADHDQRLYRLRADRAPEALTSTPPAPTSWRHGAPALGPGPTVAVLREVEDPGGVHDEIVLIDPERRRETIVAAGHDFFDAPALSPDGRHLAVVAWDDPDMPWDSTVLIEVDLADGSHRVVLGGPGESVTQPRYGPDATLYAISDRSGWWNVLARVEDAWAELGPLEAEFAPPPWLAGETSYVARADGSVLASWTRGGIDHLGVLTPTGGATTLEGPWTTIEAVAHDGRSAVLSGGPYSRDEVVTLDSRGTTPPRVLTPGPPGLARGDVALPEVLSVTTPDGPVPALYYPPTNAEAVGPRGEAPPALLHAHSGPTRRAPAQYDPGIQFWTTRGYAYLDVNYAGSSGFGRAYRERLRGRWGVVDVEDCAACVAWCAERGLIDPARVVSIGSSASGVTTLGLARRGVVAAAALRYPVTDLRQLARATARFEAHYLEGLVGPLPGADALYRERSAVAFAHELTTPLALFHGTRDEVVPLEQSLALAAALDARGVPHCLVVVEGEGHGFRDPATWRREAAIEVAFFTRVLGLGPFDEGLGVEIRHAGALAPLA